jgi:F-type H+-transporting ATPase subunit epsilon
MDMADKLHFSLVSPARELMSEDVDMVVVPGTEGDFGVLAQHAPVIATLRPGFLTVHNGTEAPQKVFVDKGFAEVTPTSLSILTEEAIPATELKGNGEIDQRIKNAEEDLSVAKDAAARHTAEEEIGHLQAIKTAVAEL